MRFALVMLAVLLALLTPSGGAAWTWPVEGPVLRPFVFGSDPYAAGQHRGVDLGAAEGARVLAPASGFVLYAGPVPRGGETVSIETADGLTVSLLHLGAVWVRRGAAVGEGDPVGSAGRSGEPEGDGVSVHLGIRVSAEPHGYLDPLSLLPPRELAPPPAAEEALSEGAPATGEPAAVSAAVAPLTVEPAGAGPVSPPSSEPASLPAVAGQVEPADAAVVEAAAEPAEQAPATVEAVTEPAVAEPETVPGLAEAAPGAGVDARAVVRSPAANRQAFEAVDDPPAASAHPPTEASAAVRAAPAVERIRAAGGRSATAVPGRAAAVAAAPGTATESPSRAEAVRGSAMPLTAATVAPAKLERVRRAPRPGAGGRTTTATTTSQGRGFGAEAPGRVERSPEPVRVTPLRSRPFPAASRPLSLPPLRVEVAVEVGRARRRPARRPVETRADRAVAPEPARVVPQARSGSTRGLVRPAGRDEGLWPLAPVLPLVLVALLLLRVRRSRTGGLPGTAVEPAPPPPAVVVALRPPAARSFSREVEEELRRAA